MKNRGDTLVEIVVAIVVLGIIAIGGMNAFMVARESNRISSKILQADNLATTLIDEADNLDYTYLIKLIQSEENDELGEPSEESEETQELDLGYLNPLSGYCELQIPSSMRLEDGQTWIGEYNSATGAITLTLSDIKAKKTEFEAKVTLDPLPYESNYNDVELVNLKAFTSDRTCIIDQVGNSNKYEVNEFEKYVKSVTENSAQLTYYNTLENEASYENLALNQYMLLSHDYRYNKYMDKLQEVWEENLYRAANDMFLLPEPVWGDRPYVDCTIQEIASLVSKELILNVYKAGSFIKVEPEIVYTLDDSSITESDYQLKVLDPSADNAEIHNELDSTNFTDLRYVYLMYVPLQTSGSDSDIVWKSDKISLYNGRADLGSPVGFDLYIVHQPFDTGNNIVNLMLGDGALEVHDSGIDETKVTVHTNAIDIINSWDNNLAIYNNKYTRMYNIIVEIRYRGESLVNRKRTAALK